MINRPQYLKKLFDFKDKRLIKIVTGVRRSGKSTLFMLYQNELKKQGVLPEQIQSINLEDVDNEHLLDYKILHEHVKTHLINDKQNYVFLDEIQNVKDFEKAVRSLFDKDNVDLYLTGSNSKLQSGQWATSLAGRYIEILMLPLSFKEYLTADPFSNLSSIDEKFQQYLDYSSFPYALDIMKSNIKCKNVSEGGDKKLQKASVLKSQINDYLSGIYNSIVLKDVVENKKIKEVSRLEKLIKFMANNIGSETSVKKISDTMTSDGVKILPLTVESYIDAFLNSYVLYQADRYDVKGKKILKTLNKYYLVDMGLRRLIVGDRGGEYGHILENVVYLELLRRGYKVYVGKVDLFDKESKKVKTTEIDFIAEGVNGIEYYQVCETVRGKETLARELASLDAIRDHYPKFLLTRDYDQVTHNGIVQKNVLKWLLDEE